MELLQVEIGARIETLLNTPDWMRKSCGSECDATYLGLLLRKLTENKISYSAGIAERPYFSQPPPPSPFFTVSFKGLSPTSIAAMVNSWRSELPCSHNGPYGSSKSCVNKQKPFGEEVTKEAQNLPTSPQDSKIASGIMSFSYRD